MNRFKQWLDDQRVAPTLLGLQLMLVALSMLVPAYLLSVNLIFLLASFLFSMVLYNFLVVRQTLRHLSLTADPLSELFRGQPGRVTLQLHTTGRFALRQLEVCLLSDAHTAGPISIDSVKPQHNTTLSLTLMPTQRGRHVWHTALVKTAFPFGLFQAQRRIPLHHHYLVYPELLPTPHLALAQNAQTGKTWLSSEELSYLTAYQPGQDVRHIHWKKSATQDVPVMKKFVQQHDQTLPFLFVPDPCAHFEFALSALATFAHSAPTLQGWQILTEQGLVRTENRESMLAQLATLAPLPAKPDALPGFQQLLYASDLSPNAD